MFTEPVGTGVQLPISHASARSASELTYAMLREAVERFPEVFQELVSQTKSSILFRKRHVAELLMAFESIRGSSPQRPEIARFISDLVQKRLLFISNGDAVPLEREFRRSSDPLPVALRESRDVVATRATFKVDLEYEGHGNRDRDEMIGIMDRLVRESLATKEAIRALEWIVDHASREDFLVSKLKGEKFVLLGGTAELSPLSLLLSAGADLLTTHSSLDKLEQKLASEMPQSGRYIGRLFYVPDGINVLTSPAAFAETIIQFAHGDKVNVGAFAYKGGQGREWRLAAAMDGIVRRVHSAGVLGSVIYYLSPSVITEVSPITAAISQERLAKERTLLTEAWRLFTANTLFRPNILKVGQRYWAQSVVPDQGASYAVANLFGKVYAAEVFFNDAVTSASGLPKVSANVAPITLTASNDTRETRTAFPELSRLGIKIFEPRMTRTLMFWLAMYDLLHPNPESVETLFAKQIHGGVLTNPWALNSVMKSAYYRGRVRRLSPGSADSS